MFVVTLHSSEKHPTTSGRNSGCVCEGGDSRVKLRRGRPTAVKEEGVKCQAHAARTRTHMHALSRPSPAVSRPNSNMFVSVDVVAKQSGCINNASVSARMSEMWSWGLMRAIHRLQQFKVFPF